GWPDRRATRAGPPTARTPVAWPTPPGQFQVPSSEFQVEDERVAAFQLRTRNLKLETHYPAAASVGGGSSAAGGTPSASSRLYFSLFFRAVSRCVPGRPAPLLSAPPPSRIPSSISARSTPSTRNGCRSTPAGRGACRPARTSARISDGTSVPTGPPPLP